MLALDDPAWAKINHAYGPASDMPGLLAKLAEFPEENRRSEPWHTLWSALCHQDSVFDASFAAVPHIVAALSSNPSRATLSFFALPVCIELARAREEREVPSSLRLAYVDALRALGAVSVGFVSEQWDEHTKRAASAAAALAADNYSAASAIIDPDDDE